jgi:segregation and condensation protein B
MTEGRNAKVIPFVDRGGRGDEGSRDNPGREAAFGRGVRMAEAIVFASAEPVSEKALAARLPEGIDVAAVMAGTARQYEKRGVNLVRVGDGWAFRTAAISPS